MFLLPGIKGSERAATIHQLQSIVDGRPPIAAHKHLLIMRDIGCEWCKIGSEPTEPIDLGV